MHDLVQDIRHAFRMMSKSPALTAAVVLTLSLGIGPTVVLFSIVNTVLIRPLPFPEPSRLVSLACTNTKGQTAMAFSYPDFLDYRTTSARVAQIGAYRPYPVTISEVDQPARVMGLATSSNLFALLGVKPLIGRTFSPDEDKPSASPPPVLLSYSLWLGRYQGMANIVGTDISLSNRRFRIIGIMPRGFNFPIQAEPVELWTTFVVDSKSGLQGERGARYLDVLARLAPGVSLTEAQTALRTVASNLATQFPSTNAAITITVTPELQRLVGMIKPALTLFLAATGIIFLIAIVNIANLLVAHLTVRDSELAVRHALGANTRRLLQQVVTENVLMAALGGALGTILAAATIGAVTSISPVFIPRLSETRVDGQSLLFAALSSLAVVILISAAGSARLSMAAIRSGTIASRASAPVGRVRLRAVLVTCEVALAVVVLVSSGLLTRSLLYLLGRSPGFDAAQVLTSKVSLPRGRYPAEKQIRFFEETCDKLGSTAGIAAAAAVYPIPLSGESLTVGVDIFGSGELSPGEMSGDDHASAIKSHQQIARVYVITSDYFRTLKIPMSAGRQFSIRDTDTSTASAIVSRSFALAAFGAESPIGQHIRPGIAGNGAPLMREIVGIAGDVGDNALGAPSTPQVYIPLSQLPMNSLALLTRTTGNPEAIVNTVRQVVAERDRQVPVYGVKTMSEYAAAQVAQPRFNAILTTCFAVLALALAVIGISGVTAEGVTQRRRELAIRAAIGATNARLIAAVIIKGMTLALLGGLIGDIIALAAGRLLSGLMFGVRPLDPTTLIVVTFLVVAIGGISSYIPARKVITGDLANELRYQ
jgi:putative ABC transport system permease protein